MWSAACNKPSSVRPVRRVTAVASRGPWYPDSSKTSYSPRSRALVPCRLSLLALAMGLVAIGFVAAACGGAILNPSQPDAPTFDAAVAQDGTFGSDAATLDATGNAGPPGSCARAPASLSLGRYPLGVDQWAVQDSYGARGRVTALNQGPVAC